MKNVLIISGMPFRTDTNLGKTLLGLFNKVDSSNLAQLYLNPQLPNTDKCSTYYQASEQQLLRSCFGILANKCGSIHNGDENISKNSEVYRNSEFFISNKGKSIMIPICRDLLWALSFWKSKKLYNWIERFKPDAIFCPMPGSCYMANTISHIAKKYNLPVYMFVTDDYYNDPKQSKNPLNRIYYKALQSKIDRVGESLKMVVGCSDLAAVEFGSKYNTSYMTSLTPSSSQFTELPLQEAHDGPIRFRYFGNLGLERWRTLVELGNIIKELNRDDKKALLEVYSNLTDEKIIKQLTIPNGCEYKGWISGNEYLKALQSSDVAVHVESFSLEMMRRTRLSVSTKVADYLGAGKCILAIGSRKLASIQHLDDVAFVAESKDEIIEKVKFLMENPEERLRHQHLSRSKANLSHNSLIIEDQIVSLFN